MIGYWAFLVFYINKSPKTPVKLPSILDVSPTPSETEGAGEPVDPLPTQDDTTGEETAAESEPEQASPVEETPKEVVPPPTEVLSKFEEFIVSAKHPLKLQK